MLEKSIAAINKIQGLIRATIYAQALPFTCILCSQLSDRQQDLCQSCFQDLPIIAQSCPRCANKIPLTAAVNRDLCCGSCLKSPPPFSAAHALFAYEPPLISLILDLKFKQQLAYARILGELMAEKIQQEWYRDKPLPDLIIPVPLHEQRLKERGFNQALELARPLAQALNLPLDASMARRVQDTATQMRLPAEKRRGNVKKAFVVEKELQGKGIAIVDDVVTTGATVGELSRVLLEKGAGRVEVWCCARTVRGIQSVSLKI